MYEKDHEDFENQAELRITLNKFGNHVIFGIAVRHLIPV